MPDPFPFAGEAQLIEESFVLGHFEFLFGTVDPDGTQAQRMGRQHQIAHDQTAVICFCFWQFLRQIYFF